MRGRIERLQWHERESRLCLTVLLYGICWLENPVGSPPARWAEGATHCHDARREMREGETQELTTAGVGQPRCASYGCTILRVRQ